MKTTLDEIEAWRSLPSETERLEFKEAKNTFDDDKLFRYCVALANEGGGHLVLGMTDKPPRRIVGSLAYPNPNVAKKILDELRFRVDVEAFPHSDGRLVIFHVPSRPVGSAYAYKGAYLMRSHESLVAMPESRLRQILSEGQPDWSEQVALCDCDGSDVVRLLDTQGYFDLKKLAYPSTRQAVLEHFSAKGFINHNAKGWSIRNLGAVLFAKKLSDFKGMGRKAARVVVYRGKGKLFTRLDTATGNDNPFDKGYAVVFENLLAFINGQIPQNEVVGQALRGEVQMFPAIAIRELVANALIHQDFNERGGSVLIEIYDDRMEISNQGKPFVSPTALLMKINRVMSR